MILNINHIYTVSQQYEHIVRYDIWENDFEQMSHLNGFSPARVYEYVVRCDFWVNDSEQVLP